MARELSPAERARLLALETWLCDRASGRAAAITDGADDTDGSSDGSTDGSSDGSSDGSNDTCLDARDQGHLARLDPRRVHVYEKLVHATLSEAIAVELPLTSALGGAAFTEHVSEFLRGELPRSPILRDVAFEFARFALPRLASDARLPAFLGDLARYELFELEVCWAERGVVAPAELGEELAGDRAVALDGTCRIARFDFAVHELADDQSHLLGARVPSPRREPTHLLGYRDASDTFRRMTLTPLAAAFVVRLLHHREPLASALAMACADHGRAPDPSVIDGAASVLEDLAARGALLGAHLARAARREGAPSEWQAWLCDPTATIARRGP